MNVRIRRGNALPLTLQWAGMLLIQYGAFSVQPPFRWWLLLIQVLSFCAALYTTIRLLEHR